jgi:all-trans-retinol dehydrogenase (NAD+)
VVHTPPGVSADDGMVPPMTMLHGATVLVTGAGTGIGRLVALEAARRGAAHLALWDIDVDRLDRVAEEVRGLGSAASAHACDVSDRTAVHRVASEVLALVGGVDVVVNNAGVVSGAPLLELTDEQIAKTFEVNVLALYWVTRPFLAGMVERGRGHVVTVASAAGLVGVARQTDYSASKHAAVGFDESLRVELSGTAPGVRTTVVCPYYVDTGMFEGVRTRVPILLPILRPEPVAARIVAAIEKDRAVLIMPPLVRLLPLLRVLPPRAFDRIMDLFGVNRSMDHFTGRTR